MKSTGLVRRIDKLGRIVIAKELRRSHGLESGTPVEMLINDDGDIVLHKHIQICSICGKESMDLHRYEKAKLCDDCLSKIK